MKDKKQEKRKYDRYNTELKTFYEFAYDLETKVDFQLIDKEKEKVLSKKYSAVTRNISVEGLNFVSRHKLKLNDSLHLEVYLPNIKDPIYMKGTVKWCKPSPKEKNTYQVGVVLIFVKGEPVHESIHYDKEYAVNWSIVLESVFGNYKMLMGGKYKKQSKS